MIDFWPLLSLAKRALSVASLDDEIVIFAGMATFALDDHRID
ncbi:unnamed protein product [Acidithrix sp. C25]|nr:unnamed protein product [Acidithrix sp. C25]